VIYTDPSWPTEQRIDDLLSRMTLDEKIGQMTQVEKNSIKAGDITKYYIGSILSGGGGSPEENTPQAWYAMWMLYMVTATCCMPRYFRIILAWVRRTILS
jgi:hypothetical protein